MAIISFVDTETTGFSAGDYCWHVGVVRCEFEESSAPYSEPFSVAEFEFVLPIMTADLPFKAFQRGTIIEYSRPDCEDAAEYARDFMSEGDDKEDFKIYMRNYLTELRDDRIFDIRIELDEADEIWAWQAPFDQKVINKTCSETYEIQCAMQQFRGMYPGRRWKLALAADSLGIRVDGAKHHTALYDALLLKEVWFTMHGIDADKETPALDSDAFSRIRRAFGRGE